MESLSARRRCGVTALLLAFAGLLALHPSLTAQDAGNPPVQSQEDHDLHKQLQVFEERLRRSEERIHYLEDTSDALEEAVGGDRAVARVYSAKALDLGGHISGQYWSYHGQDGDVTGFYAIFTELYIKAELGEDWSLFATPGVYAISDVQLQDLRNPEITIEKDHFQVIMARAYLQWSPEDELRIRAGIQSTELGVISRSGFIPDRILGTPPLMSRIYTLNSLYPQVVNGVSVGGRLGAGNQPSDWWEYSAYVGSEIQSPSDPALGARLGYFFGKLGLTVNVSYAHGVRQDASSFLGMPVPQAANLAYSISPVPVFSNEQNRFDLGGIDLEFSKGDFGLKAEAFLSSEDSQVMKDKTGFFVQPTWWFAEQAALTYRFDYYDSGHGFGPARENVLGITWDPIPALRLRAAYYRTDYRQEILNAVSLSFSVSF